MDNFFRSKFLLTFSLVILAVPLFSKSEINGFDVENIAIPKDKVISGGPPRDGIPAIDNPVLIDPGKARFMKSGDMVISFTHKNDTRAYPIRILNWHEIVNDEIGDLAISVTYCPLCGTGMVFDRTINGRKTTFGVGDAPPTDMEIIMAGVYVGHQKHFEVALS